MAEVGVPLTGGGMTSVLRVGNRVHRGRGRWSDRVEQLLTRLGQAGFAGAPRFHGLSSEGAEILDYLPGEVGSYPLSAAVCSDSALVTAAALLRRLHDATAPFAAELPGGWMLPDRAPAEVICHGDFTPYNCVFDGEQVVGVIDFDAAHPGPRLWDIAYAVYRFAPLTAPTNPDGFGTVAEQAARARQFCDSYGLIDRGGLLATAGQRLIALIAFIRTEAAAGNAAFARHLAEGHDLAYQRDIDYLDEHRAELDRLLA